MYKSPRSSREFESDSVNIDLSTGTSVSDVAGVALSNGQILARGSDSILYYNFDYVGACTRIVARIHVSRLARIQDRVVQLWDGARLIGSNLANPSAPDINLYEFTGAFTVTPEFGLVLDLGPNQRIPSRDTVYIRSVGLAFIP